MSPYPVFNRYQSNKKQKEILMKEFVLLFRLNDIGDAKPSPEQIQERMDWLPGTNLPTRVAGYRCRRHFDTATVTECQQS